MTDAELEWLKFYWDVWKSEVKAFWTNAILVSTALLVTMAFQYGLVTLSVPWLKVNPPKDPVGLLMIVNLYSWFLISFLAFRFVDLLRHRVPDKFEGRLHNNFLPGRGMMRDLRKVARWLYVIFPLYVLVVAGILGWASLHLFLMHSIPTV